MQGEPGTGTGGDPTAVGATGPGAGAVADLVAAAGGDSVTGSPADVLAADPDVVVATGAEAALAVAKAAPATPVLAVDAGPELCSVPRDRLPDALPGLLEGAWTGIEHALLEVSAGDRTIPALLDVTLVTVEPARISEYRVTTGGDGATGTTAAAPSPTDVDEGESESGSGNENGSRNESGDSGGTRVGRFRADGVVAATPAGSQGYARSAGGPVLDPATDAAVVVPIAPFSITQARWVVGYPLSLTVVRDEGAVALYVDGEDAGIVETNASVTVALAGTATFAGVPEREPFFGPLEKT
jgi:NAD+ kinase